jgi:hypothetical protein
VADWAVDGKPNSRWASDGPGADNAVEEQWLQLDLGTVCFIDSVNLEWERAYSRDYDIEISNDGLAWTNVHDENPGNGGGIGGKVQVRMLHHFARYVRIYSYQGEPTWGISLFEVKIFGDPDDYCDPPQSTGTCRRTIIDLDAATASASTIEGSHWIPDKAIDGDMISRWSSAFTDDAWFAVDLGAMTRIDHVWLYWEYAYPEKYELQVKDSLEDDWTTIVEINNSDGEVDVLDNLSAETQYVRLLCIERARGYYGNSLFAFEVRGTQVEACLS